PAQAGNSVAPSNRGPRLRGDDSVFAAASARAFPPPRGEGGALSERSELSKPGWGDSPHAPLAPNRHSFIFANPSVSAPLAPISKNLCPVLCAPLYSPHPLALRGRDERSARGVGDHGSRPVVGQSGSRGGWHSSTALHAAYA